MPKSKKKKKVNAHSALAIVHRFDKRVTKVYDAKEPLVVEVTEKDCKSRAVKNHAECAMAVAVKRQEHATSAIIARSTAYIIRGDTAYRYKTGGSVGREVTAFDRGASFEPGVYRLRAPSTTERMGEKNEQRGNTGTGKNPESKRFRHVTDNIREVLYG